MKKIFLILTIITALSTPAKSEEPVSLLEAIQTKNQKVAFELLSRGVDPNQKFENNLTPLHWAAAKGMDRIVKLLLTKYNVDPNVKGENGWTAMHIAAINDYPKVIRHLLDNRGNLSETDEKGWAPIHLAALNGKVASVSSFIRLGVDVDIKGRYDWTPLFNSAAKGKGGVVELLLKKRANANAKDIYGKTALDYAQESLDNYLQYKNDNSIEASGDAVEQSYNLTISNLEKYMKK